MSMVSGWQRLLDVYYTLETCGDDPSWDIDVDISLNFRVAALTLAIALALKFVVYPNVVDVYGLNGKKLLLVVYNSTPSNHIVDFALHGDNLVLVLSTGWFRYYSDFDGHFNEYDLVTGRVVLQLTSNANGTVEEPYITNLENNQREQIVGVILAKVWGDVLVVQMARGFTVVELPTQNRSVISYYFGHNYDSIHTYTGIDSTLYLLVNALVVKIDVDFVAATYDIVDHELTDGPFSQMAICPNGNIVALFNSVSATVSVVNRLFSQILLTHSATGEYLSVTQMEWVGNDAIALAMRDEVRVIGPSQQLLSFFYDTVDDQFDISNLLSDPLALADVLPYVPITPILATSFDGAFVYSMNKIQFLTRVGSSQLELFQVGLASPATILLDCLDERHSHAPKADINISLLKSEPGTLVLAINTCVDVAVSAFLVTLQKKLLRAVAFGKIYLDESDQFNGDGYVNAVNTLKVLNQIRSHDVGMFVTFDQFTTNKSNIVYGLLRRHKFGIALKMTEMLSDFKCYRPVVFQYWCSAKIRGCPNASDTELYEIIKNKLMVATPQPSHQNQNYLEVTELIETAYEEGRTQLCKQIIGLEPNINHRIRAYLKYDEFELALVVALQLGNVDMAAYVLSRLQRELSMSQFYRVLNQTELILAHTEGSTIFSKVLGDVIGNFWVHSVANPSEIETYYQQHDDNRALALQQYAQRTSDYDSVKQVLVKLKQSTGDMKPVFSRQLDLLECRLRMNDMFETNEFLIDLDESLVQTLVRLIKMNQLKQGAKVVKQFRVSVEKWWYLVLKTYVELDQWQYLYYFQSNEKLPIGYKPFIDAGLAHHAPKEHISEYIRKSTLTPGEKLEYYLKNGDVANAADIAFKQKDVARLKEMQEQYHLDEHQQLIQVYLGKLSG